MWTTTRRHLAPLAVYLLATGGSAATAQAEVIPTPICAEVEIDGSGPYRVGFDSGVSVDAMIDPGASVRLALRSAGKVEVTDASHSGAQTLRRVEVSSLVLSGRELGPAHALVGGLRGGDCGPEAIGTLGFALFRNRLLTVDFGSGALWVTDGSLPPADGQHIVEYTVDPSMPEIEVATGEDHFRVAVDSGGEWFLHLPAALADRLPIAGRGESFGRIRTISGEFEFEQAELDGDLRFGGLRLHRPPVTISDHFPRPILGRLALADLELTFDQAHRRLRIRRALSAANVPREGPERGNPNRESPTDPTP